MRCFSSGRSGCSCSCPKDNRNKYLCLGDNYHAQTGDSEQLDIKLTAVLAAATAAMAFGARLPRPNKPTMPEVGAPWTGIPVADFFFYLAAACWAVIVLVATWNLATKRYRRSYQADVLWNQYRDEEPSFVKRLVVVDIADAYAHNRGVLSSKGRAVTITVLTTALEGLSLALVLIFSA
jgi:hypothetical protein